MQKHEFSKVANQLYLNHTSAWALSCKFPAYLQKSGFNERLWKTVPMGNCKFSFSIPAILLNTIF